MWRVLVPVIALAAGVLFATSAETAQGTDLRAGRRIELTQLIAAQEQAVGESTKRAVTLQSEVDALEKDASTRDGRVGAVRAGQPAAGGPGRAAAAARERADRRAQRRAAAAGRVAAAERPARTT